MRRFSIWKTFRSIALAAGLLVSTLNIVPAEAQVPAVQDPTDFVPGELLVQFKPAARQADKDDAHAKSGGRVKKEINGLAIQVVDVPAGEEKAKAAVYRRNPNVAFAELNGTYSAIWSPSDPEAGKQWQFNNTGQTGGTMGADIEAQRGWDLTTGNSGVIIAILDTGIDQDHPDLANKVARNANYSTSSTVDDLHGHGTHVAGSAAAISNNSAGVAGTCPNCSLWNIKVLGDDGSGSWAGIASGISDAANNGAQVISMSLGGSYGSTTVQTAVNDAWSKGVLLVAAAGNSGIASYNYPGAYSNVIAVGATDHNDLKASFSNYGSWVDVAAPGKSILSTAPNHSNKIWGSGVSYGTIDGTSMATPHVAGLAGLVWSTNLCGAKDNACVRSRIEQGADPVALSYWTHGRINAYNTLKAPDSLPSVAITDPAANQTVSGLYPVAITASDTEGPVVRVEVAAGGSTWTDITPTGVSGSYTYAWDTRALADGVYSLAARATDGAGQTSTSTISVKVENLDSAPTATIVSPATGSVAKGTITIRVKASDDAGLASVGYTANGAAAIGMTLDPASGEWVASLNTTQYQNGSTLTLGVMATDNAGQTALATPVTITVDNATPRLATTVTTDRASYTRGAYVYATVRATDANGAAVSGASVAINFVHSTGTVAASGSGTTNSAGEITFRWRTRYSTARGTYTAQATTTRSGYEGASASSAPFTIN